MTSRLSSGQQHTCTTSSALTRQLLETHERHGSGGSNRSSQQVNNNASRRPLLLQPAPGDNPPRCLRYDAPRLSDFSWTREEFLSASRLMRGTRMVSYRSVYDNDRLPGSSDLPLAGVRLHSITAMPFYENRSFEELRMEDTRPHNSCSIGDRIVSTSTSTSTSELISKVVVLESSSCTPQKEDALPPLDETIDERACVICLDSRRSIAFFPCKHLCACLPCSSNRQLTHCPVCREDIVMKTTIYW